MCTVPLIERATFSFSSESVSLAIGLFSHRLVKQPPYSLVAMHSNKKSTKVTTKQQITQSLF